MVLELYLVGKVPMRTPSPICCIVRPVSLEGCKQEEERSVNNVLSAL